MKGTSLPASPSIGETAERAFSFTGRSVQNRIGWLKRDETRDEFLIPPETWRSDICAPATIDPITTARTLAEAGFLRRDGKNLTVKERLPGFANPVRVYAVSAALLESAEADGDAPNGERRAPHDRAQCTLMQAHGAMERIAASLG